MSVDVVGVARGAGINVVGSYYNQALRFAITFLIARVLGPGQLGRYFQAFAFLALLTLLASGGFVNTLTRFVAVHRADGDDAATRGTIRLGLLVPCVLALVLSVALYLLASPIALHWFHEARMVVPLRFVAATLLPTVLTDAALGATRGFQLMKPYAMVNLFFEPSLRIVLTGALMGIGMGLRGALWALFVTNVVAAAAASVWLARLVSDVPYATPRYAWAELFSFSGVYWVSTLASTGLIWADSLLLGYFRGPADVGIYQIATRLVLLAAIVSGPLTMAFSPRVADLHRRGETESLQRTYAIVAGWLVRLSLPAFIVLFIFARDLLSLVGPRFVAAAAVTLVLAAGQLINAFTGASGIMLLMSGRPVPLTVINMLALGLNIGLNVALIPRWGVLGAAIAWAVSIAAFALAKLVAVWVTMRMLPFERGLIKGATAGIAAAAVALAFAQLFDGFVGLATGGGAAVAAYIAALALLGLGVEDRLVLDTLRNRLRPT